ncbi:MFS transporter, SP family [Opisthorchis viverrini]|uniref:MFS transporter, SP family n=1 Tax=Opisthorchis viverrini TaxID=6198 RepID=A0A1S8WLP6_OPIVI|nr:MFS transporter, SP family [Opisthorchis viverrini]
MLTEDLDTRAIIPSRKRPRWVFPLIASVLSAVGGLLFGYDTGVISGAMIQIRQQFSLSYFYQELIVSVTLVSAAVAALSCAWLTDWLGRKPIIIGASVIFTAGALTMGASFTKELLLIGRLIVGVGIGMASMTVPVYIAEIAPSHMRGTLVTLNTVCITAGQVIASVVDGLFMSDVRNGWRYMLALGGIPSFIQFFGFLAMPETPRWLVERGRIEEARAVLMRIDGEQESTSAIEADLQRMVSATRVGARRNAPSNPFHSPPSPQGNGEVAYSDWQAVDTSSNEVQTSEQDADSLKTTNYSSFLHASCFQQLTIVRILRNPTTRKALFVGCGLQLFQQFVGINTVMYYSASIISMAGIGAGADAKNRDSTAVWLAALVASANFAFCCISPWLISRLRRRTLLLGSLVGVFASLVVLGISFQLIASFSVPVDLVEQIPLVGDVGQCLKASTCDTCMRTTMCGFCYNWYGNNVVNGSCLPAPERFAEYSSYGRCANGCIFLSPFVLLKFQTASQDTIWAFDHCPTPYGWMTVLGLIMYLASFASGMAPLPWTINSELYPTWARSTGVACSTGTNWIANVIVSLSFLSLTEAITRQGAYFLYACVAVLAIIFVCYCVPETGNMTLEEINVDNPYFLLTKRNRQLSFDGDPLYLWRNQELYI